MNAGVTVIGGASNHAIGSIATDFGSMDPRLNPVQNRIYVANLEFNSISVLRDSMSGIEDSHRPQAASSKSLPTVIRGVLLLAERPSSSPSASYLLDIGGRQVMALKPGANDVSRLAPGVYFVREAQAQAQAQAVRKVVIQR